MPKPPPSSSPFWKAFNGVTVLNRIAYRLSGGRVGGKMPGSGAPIILVHHVGKKSGTERVSPLIGLEDDGRWLIVASKGGTDRNPAWYHNLIASPDTEIELGNDRIPVRVRQIEGEERELAWSKLVETYPPYAEYQVYAEDRVIPVLSLDPR
jgi:deazaflavin-dependent oxidoreductase (nitroreductase family)